MTIPRLHTSGPLIAAAPALCALAVYVRTLAPSVSGEDSGELIAASVTLGIPHPPGYPLWCLLTHPFTWLPLGSVAWRVNLASACFAAAAVYVLALLLLRLTGSRRAAAAGALALAFSREFWEQAIIAEVYTLNALCILLCVYFLERWREGRAPGWLYAFALGYGLSLGNHSNMLVLGPVFAVYIALAKPALLRQFGTLIRMLSIAGLGSLVYLYLPLRSRANPPVDWGNPENWDNFWAVVFRRQFAFMTWEEPHSLPRFLRQLAVFAEFSVWEFTPAGLILGVLGLLALIRRGRPGAILLLAIGLVSVAGACFIQNFSFDKEWRWVMSVFGIPFYAALAAGIGGSVAWLARRPGWASRAAAPMAAVCVAAPLFAHWEHNDRRNHYWADAFGRYLLETLAPDAVYVSETDHGVFPAMYLQTVEGLRPDVTLGRKYGYVEPAFGVGLAPEALAKIGPFPRRRDEGVLLASLLRNTGRPVYFERPRRLPEAPEIRLEQCGLIWRALRPGETAAERDCWGRFGVDPLDLGPPRGDYTAELILYTVHTARANEAFARGDHGRALREVEAALDAYGWEPQVLNNLGVLCARHGETAAAAFYFEAALERNPGLEAARVNLARLRG